METMKAFWHGFLGRRKLVITEKGGRRGTISLSWKAIADENNLQGWAS